MKTIIHVITCLFFIFSAATASFALDLQTAKDKGLVGETTSGYLAPVKAGNKEAAKLVQEINAKRKQTYQKIAQRNKTSLKSVEQLAGKKAIEKTPGGQLVQIGGQWKKK